MEVEFLDFDEVIIMRDGQVISSNVEPADHQGETEA